MPARTPMTGAPCWVDLMSSDPARAEAFYGSVLGLEKISRERWTIFRRFLPSRRNPLGVTDRSVIEGEIARALAAGDQQ